MTTKFGVVFPQTEIEADPAYIRDYAQTAEGIGFDYLLTFDHVLGANPDRPDGLNGSYTHKDPFYEPFVLFSYLAAITQKIELTTGIIILPQRQTTLVAKQAATLDVLSNGRLRVGVGVGWNTIEYEALNKEFHNRGKRLTEQVEVLRQLWTQPLVTYQGEYHTISDAGLNPMPIQQPIPIWFGGGSDAALRRMAKFGDGWISHSYPPDKLAEMLDTLREYITAEGRNPDEFGVDYHILMDDKTPDQLRQEVETLQSLGVNHICVYTMGARRTPSEHLNAIRKFRDILPP